MKPFQGVPFLLLLFSSLLCIINVTKCFETESFAIAIDVVKVAKGLWDIYQENPRDLIDKNFKALSYQYDLIQSDFEKTDEELSAINKKIESLPAIIQLIELMSKARSPFQKLSDMYEKMEDFVKKPDKYNERVIKDFAKAVISNNAGIDDLIRELNGLIVGTPAFPSIPLLKFLVEHTEVYIIHIHCSLIFMQNKF